MSLSLDVLVFTSQMYDSEFNIYIYWHTDSGSCHKSIKQKMIGVRYTSSYTMSTLFTEAVKTVQCPWLLLFITL